MKGNQGWEFAHLLLTHLLISLKLNEQIAQVAHQK